MAMNPQKMLMQMQQQMARVQEELETATVEGSAGGGVVKATVTGKQDLVGLVIDPATDSPFAHWDDLAFTPHAMSPLLEREFRGLPPGTNLFECTGAPGSVAA